MPIFSATKTRRVKFEAHGVCRRRLLELEWFKAFLGANGFVVADSSAEADLLVFYHCCFNADGEASALRYLKDASQIISDIVVLGGLANLYSSGALEKMLGGKRIHCASLRDYRRIDSLFADSVSCRTVPLSNHSPAVSETWSIQVGLGCASACSYCGDRKIVGPLHSFPLDGILRQFKKGVELGYTRFDLVGDDVGAWGIDIGGSVIELLDAVTAGTYDYTISLQEVNIKYLIQHLDRLGAILARGKIDFLVVAFQHVNDRLLRLMERGYAGGDVERLLQALEKHCIAARFHALLGFPSETWDELRENMCFINGHNFSSGSCFVYQKREYAPASLLDGHFTEDELRETVAEAYSCLTAGGYAVEAIYQDAVSGNLPAKLSVVGRGWSSL